MEDRESRLIVDAEGQLLWLMYGITYLEVSGVNIISRNSDLANIESYLYEHFT